MESETWNFESNTIMLNENLISTLEQSLRQTRNAQNRLVARLRELETESDSLRQEIQALENSASQTEQAIYSLLATMRSGKPTWQAPPQQHLTYKEDDYQPEARQPMRPQNNNQNQQNYNNNPVAYINNPRNIPSATSHIEPVSQRFSDRTITQACTLILRESGRALHVNELYNSLCAGGFSFSGNNPTISIAVSLNRNRRFRKVAPGTFDLIIRDVSQAAS
jgi:hypothetical protein